MILPKARSNNIIVLNLEKELLVYDLSANKAFSLNETSSIVYQNSDGKTSFAELKAKYKFSDELIFFALDELEKERLIETDQNYQSPFEKLSRREVVKKVGLSTILAIPVIFSVIAPKAINAASGNCVTTNCTPDNYRQGNCCGSTNRCFGNNTGFGNCFPCYQQGNFLTICNGTGCCSDPAVTFNSQNACCSGSHTPFEFQPGSFECRCT